jgi:inosine-uridine nucleoside N-ribohydrolase
MAFVCAIHSGSVGGTVAGRAVAPLDVIGLTSIFGNVHTELATANALRLVELGI